MARRLASRVSGWTREEPTVAEPRERWVPSFVPVYHLRTPDLASYFTRPLGRHGNHVACGTYAYRRGVVTDQYEGDMDPSRKPCLGCVRAFARWLAEAGILEPNQLTVTKEA